MKNVEIYITGQYGGDNAGDAARTVVTKLKQKIKFPDEKICEMDLQLRFNLFVSGAVTKFSDPSGFSNIRLYLSKGYISCDIVMGGEIWKLGDAAIIEFIITAIISAVHEISGKMKTKSVVLDDSKLAALLLQAKADLLEAY